MKSTPERHTHQRKSYNLFPKRKEQKESKKIVSDSNKQHKSEIETLRNRMINLGNN